MTFAVSVGTDHLLRPFLNPISPVSKMSINLFKLLRRLTGKARRQNQELLDVDNPAIADPVQQLAWDMVQALEQDDFFLNYQPQINLSTGQLLGVETLIRWQHPQLGLISPATFIPIAEKNGLIVPMGYWVLKQSCQQYQKWCALGITPFKISVNLSQRQLQEENLIPRIQTILHETQMNPQALTLEVTESLMYKDPEQVIARLTRLKQLGIKIAIDDFGVGYSSLSYLKDLPLHTLKIDKSFIDDLFTTEKDQVILQSIIELGHRLNLDIIAEGIEVPEQLDLLREMKCDYGQGYLFSRPLGLTDMTQYFQSLPQTGWRSSSPDLALV
jgi:EAL domain-containing protein (putative c-di-GMP-specific phosphodiesterase class I)